MKELADQIRELSNQRFSDREVAKRLGIGRRRVRTLRERYGIPSGWAPRLSTSVKSENLRIRLIKEVAKLAAKGKTDPEIANLLDISMSRARSIRRQNSIRPGCPTAGNIALDPLSPEGQSLTRKIRTLAAQQNPDQDIASKLGISLWRVRDLRWKGRIPSGGVRERGGLSWDGLWRGAPDEDYINDFYAATENRAALRYGP